MQTFPWRVIGVLVQWLGLQAEMWLLRKHWKTKGMDDASMAEAQVLNHSVDFVHDYCLKSIIFEVN